MTEPGFSLPEELRFLAAQCRAHVEAPQHRDQDRQFIASLIAQLAILGGVEAENVSTLIADEAMRCAPDELTDLIRLASTAFRHGARMIEQKNQRRAA